MMWSPFLADLTNQILLQFCCLMWVLNFFLVNEKCLLRNICESWAKVFVNFTHDLCDLSSPEAKILNPKQLYSKQN